MNNKHKKMFTGHQRNAKQSTLDPISRQSERRLSRRQITTDAGEDADKGNPIQC